MPNSPSTDGLFAKGGRPSFVEDEKAEKKKSSGFSFTLISDNKFFEKILGPSAVRPKPDLIIGDYRLVSEINRGGMGIVWEAEQISLKRRVALKFLKPEVRLSSRLRCRLIREAKAGAALTHPGIVQVYAHGEVRGLHYIAQELVPGGFTLAKALTDLRERSPLPSGYYRSVAKLFKEIAESLQYAHEAGVIHRDIKPNNILIAEAGKPKVADFGLAKMEDDLSLSRSGDFLGTPPYMSPEQVASTRIEVDCRADIFALGATLYEALTFTRAFPGNTTQDVIEKIKKEDPVAPRSLSRQVPRDLSVICLKAMEKKRKHRYQTMAEFIAELDRYLDDKPIRAQPPSRIERTVKWVRRHPVISSVAIITWLAFAMISGMWLEMRAQRDRLVLYQALQELEDLKGLAKELVPVGPDKIDEYREFLDRWRRLEEMVARLSKLAESNPMQPDSTSPRFPNYQAQGSRIAFLERTLSIVETGVDPLESAPHRADRIKDSNDPEILNNEAWNLIGANRAVYGLEREGLEMARRALDLASPEQKPKILDTLAWALYFNGHYKEALEHSGLALEMAPEEEKRLFQKQLDSMLEHYERRFSKERKEGIRKELAQLRAQRSETRASILRNPEDESWFLVYSSLLEEMSLLRDERSGIRTGVSPQYGWGIEERLKFAQAVTKQTVKGEQAKARWDEATSSISDPGKCPAYQGLKLKPVLGFLPLGESDRVPGLWEFVHVQTKMVFLLVPGRGIEPGAQSETRGRAKVPLFVAKDGVTVRQWQEQFGAESRIDIPPDATVKVSREECDYFLKHTGLDLPSQDQWEYAASLGAFDLSQMSDGHREWGGELNGPSVVGPQAKRRGPIEIHHASFRPVLPVAPWKLHKTNKGIRPRGRLGSVLCPTGDLNGDGYEDYAVGTHHEDLVYVYSGADHLWLYPPLQGRDPDRTEMFGYCLENAGDLDGDGVNDLLVGAPATFTTKPGSVYAFSGADGKSLYRVPSQSSELQFGSSLASTMDWNSDGINDFFVGHFGWKSNTGRVVLCSGKNGRHLHQLEGNAIMENFGGSIDTTDDLDGDGFDELIVGAPQNAPHRENSVGSVFIYSMKDWSLLQRIGGKEIGAGFGSQVKSTGDLNGDGVQDLLVGVYYSSPNDMHHAGSVFIYSGADWSLMRRLDGETAEEKFGTFLGSLGDLNGDGVSDFAVSSAERNQNGIPCQGTIAIFSGLDDTPFFQINGGGSTTGLWPLAVVRDLGSGSESLIVGATTSSLDGVEEAGAVHIFRRGSLLKWEPSEEAGGFRYQFRE
ncbi:MAG: hypothetical protein DWQ01_10150 [Planctomycetota bacterium]|nr:MAG: hypothetical protein DWQ01_10150 [Planctomycetota bacterium]